MNKNEKEKQRKETRHQIIMNCASRKGKTKTKKPGHGMHRACNVINVITNKH